MLRALADGTLDYAAACGCGRQREEPRDSDEFAYRRAERVGAGPPGLARKPRLDFSEITAHRCRTVSSPDPRSPTRLLDLDYLQPRMTYSRRFRPFAGGQRRFAIRGERGDGLRH